MKTKPQQADQGEEWKFPEVKDIETSPRYLQFVIDTDGNIYFSNDIFVATTTVTNIIGSKFNEDLP